MIFRSLEGKLQEGGFLKDMQKIWILQVQNLKFCFSTFSCAKCAGSALTTVVWMPNVELTEKKNYRIKFEVEASFSSGMHSISIGENFFDIPPNIWHDQMKESSNILIFSTLCPAFVQNQDFMLLNMCLYFKMNYHVIHKLWELYNGRENRIFQIAKYPARKKY